MYVSPRSAPEYISRNALLTEFIEPTDPCFCRRLESSVTSSSRARLRVETWKRASAARRRVSVANKRSYRPADECQGRHAEICYEPTLLFALLYCIAVVAIDNSALGSNASAGHSAARPMIPLNTVPIALLCRSAQSSRKLRIYTYSKEVLPAMVENVSSLDTSPNWQGSFAAYPRPHQAC